MKFRTAFLLVPFLLLSCSDPEVSFRDLDEEASEALCYDQILDDLLANGDLGDDLKVDLEDYPACMMPRAVPVFECYEYKSTGTQFFEWTTGLERPYDGFKCCVVTEGVKKYCKKTPY